MSRRRIGPKLALAVLLASSVARGATYYVAPSGNDSNAGSEAAPFKTLGKGASVLKAGDTLLARAGTYAEEFYNGIPGGSSWSAPVTLKAYPGEKPVIKPASGASRVFTFASASASYIVVEGFVLDASNTQIDVVKITHGSSSGASHHIRIKSCELFGAPRQGILVTGETGKNGLDVSGNEFIDLDVHDNGTTDFDHGFYVSSAGNLIEGCRVYKNAGWGIHIYNGTADDADNNVIRNNRSYDNARIGDRGVGIGIYSGSGTIAYNNLLWGNKVGIALDYGATGAGVWNNVVYSNAEGGISIGSAASNSSVKNNAVWQNGSGITDNGNGSTLDKNHVGSDPGVVDAPNHDFHPTASSTLVDSGVTVAEVTTDIDGVSRPQGAAYDVGAYELCAGSGCGGAAGASGAGGGGASGGAGASGAAGGGAGGVGGAGGSGNVSSGGASKGGSAGSGGTAKAAGSDDDGGCGCRMASNQPRALGLILLALGALGLGSRRRNRARAQPSASGVLSN